MNTRWIFVNPMGLHTKHNKVANGTCTFANPVQIDPQKSF